MKTPKDPLIAAATRPAMKWGVTLEGIIIGIGLVSIVMLASGNPLTLLFYLPIHGVMYLLCLRDPRTFRHFLLWFGTKAKSLGWRYWGAATACPMKNTRAGRRMPE